MNTLEGYKGRAVLVTGACGTVGAELIRQLIEADVDRIVCVDNNETELFFLQEVWKQSGKVECYLADIRDFEALKLRMQDIEIVLHSAALKHVGLCEESPAQAIRTNIDGTQNVINAALANGVERVIFTSSDKAVNPTNVMGTSKLMGERLITAASLSNRSSKTIFASTRFGNVLGSRGSVIPLFRRQIDNGGPITLTDPEMTRFIMTLEEAVALVLRSTFLAHGGEVFITKMPVVRIEHIAEHMRQRLSRSEITIKVVGAKPGEKFYEELMNDEEVRRSYEMDDFFVVLPAFVANDPGRFPLVAGCPQPDRPYNSSHEAVMRLDEVGAYLDGNDILK